MSIARPLPKLTQMAQQINKETYISIGLAVLVGGMLIRIEVAIANLNMRATSLESKTSQSEQIFLRKDEAMLRLNAISGKLDRLEDLIQKK